jgi:hypothetical protein
LTLTALLITACADADGPEGEPPAEPRSWVGVVEGTDVKIAVVVSDDDTGALYFCGGDSSYREMTRWFRAKMPRSVPFEVDSSDGWVASLTLGPDAVEGRLASADGDEWTFAASTVEPGAIGGLYEGRGPCGLVGVIIDQPRTSDTPQAQGVCVSTNTEAPPSLEQVNPIAPLQLGVDRTLRVRVADSAHEYVLSPAVPRL